jgi:hypothetical protein
MTCDKQSTRLNPATFIMSLGYTTTLLVVAGWLATAIS